MLPLWTQCCVWGTSYLNDKNCPPKYSHIFPQHWNGGGREIGLRILLNYCLEKTFLKRGILRQECVKKNMTIFLIDCMKQGFLISFYQILSQKVLKMNVKITDISGTKINLFYIFRRQNSVRKTYSICCRTLQRVRVTRYHRFSLKFIWFGAIYNALPRVTTKIT